VKIINTRCSVHPARLNRGTIASNRVKSRQIAKKIASRQGKQFNSARIKVSGKVGKDTGKAGSGLKIINSKKIRQGKRGRRYLEAADEGGRHRRLCRGFAIEAAI
jgi:hypothetical protein